MCTEKQINVYLSIPPCLLTFTDQKKKKKHMHTHKVDMLIKFALF
ncbi:hypothetical protein LOK49_LG02G00007 [Camellia lanceoleosa]|uniref:Uncharacterized protein n=1 Tax=Camellia lanceoleosa TaxID=1840588 RepID=A0ACC0IR15_9ERIC|nr:hypothetical protein LOK49_LG02G00007 [Camellia lanceoleosa]